MSEPTILLVDDDAVLSQVLRRVLARQGYAVVEAGSIADAVEVARQRRPQAALIDLSLPDGDGVELARRLEREVGPIPLILMTAFPLRLRDEPELARGFAHVLTKPLNLDEVRQVVEQALASAPAAAAEECPHPAEGLSGPEKASVPPAALPPRPARRQTRKSRWILPGAAAALVLVCSLAWPALGLPNPFQRLHPAPGPAPEPTAAERVQAVPGDTDGLELPPGVVDRLGVTTTVLQKAAKPQPLELAGSLSFDPNRLYRIQARFAGEVIALGKFLEPGSNETGGQTRERDLRYGDPVRKGELMAVVLSKDLGEKKSELVDALVRLHLDEVNLHYIEDLVQRGVTPEVVLRQQRATVAADRNAAVRVELTLRTWRLPEAEIDAVKAEARRVQELGGKRDLARETEWAKVEVRAPADGVIVEKNVAVGNIVDTAFDLYKVANLHRLGVLVHAYEEDLRTLQSLPRNFPWQVRVSADPRAPVLKSDGIEQLGLVVDPSQHTDPVMGRVENTSGELKVGQFVTATVELPAPPDVVSVPADALDENGSESVDFVAPDPAHPRVFSLRRVSVAQRLGGVVYVRSILPPDQRARGLQPLRPGDVVVTHGVVELKAALEEMQAKK